MLQLAWPTEGLPIDHSAWLGSLEVSFEGHALVLQAEVEPGLDAENGNLSDLSKLMVWIGGLVVTEFPIPPPEIQIQIQIKKSKTPLFP